MTHIAKNTLLCTSVSFRKWAVDTKLLVLAVLILTFSLSNYVDIGTYARAVGARVSPWLFPHILNAAIFVPLYGCFAILLFSDAPFIDRHMPFLIIRTGRLPWILGQMLYIVLASILYSIFQYACTIVAYLHCLELTTDWGKVLRTLASNPMSPYDKGIQLTVGVDNSIIASYSAVGATLLSLGLFTLMTVFLGMLIFCLNLIAGKMTGILVAGVLAFASYFSLGIGQFLLGPRILFFSPLNWGSLLSLTRTASGSLPSIAYAVTFYIAGSLLMAGLSVWAFLRRDVDIGEGVE